MKATIVNPGAVNFNPFHRLEAHFTDEYTAFIITEDCEMLELVTLRIYSTKAVSYACCWIDASHRGFTACGSGKANGYGYHRASAAAEEAIINAGFELSDHINGRGDSYIVKAIKAIAEELTFDQFRVYTHHSHA